MSTGKIITLGILLFSSVINLWANEEQELKQVDFWQFGLNSVPNVDLALEKLNTMADAGSVPALLRLAKYYHYTLNQREKALEFWSRAAKLNSGEAAFVLSKFAPEESKRQEYFQQALALRHEPALFFNAIDIGTINKGYLLPQQRQNRRSVLLRIASRYPAAYNVLASKDLTDTERIELLNTGAALGDVSCRTALNEIYFNNQDWIMLRNSFHPPYFQRWKDSDKQIFQALQNQAKNSQ